ncbi:hypothetical protein BT67DRAFT_130313 [Trichocladium antarcticum]|uniref:Secreted protein n=1 Tax=Trichocladium antarcticum TaxID=1450529 RepID=A0AAN6ZGZ0_9PEZI|nr:hypothetical protein BT67DRAFT_130313 [Trichocladium antarcticum]
MPMVGLVWFGLVHGHPSAHARNVCMYLPRRRAAFQKKKKKTVGGGGGGGGKVGGVRWSGGPKTPGFPARCGHDIPDFRRRFQRDPRSNEIRAKRSPGAWRRRLFTNVGQKYP